MKKLLLTCAAALACATVLSGCGGAPTAPTNPSASPTPTQAASILTMSTNAEFPPFEFRDASGKIDGFDVALAEEIAKDMGRTLKIDHMAFTAALAQVAAGGSDIAAAGITKTAEREAEMDFSESYYTATQAIIVKKDNAAIKTKEDLKGKKVGVQRGTTGDIICDEDLSIGDGLARFDKGSGAVLDLNAGRLDAVVIDLNPAKKFVEQNPGLTILDEKFEDEFYCVAVKKGNTAILESVNKTVRRLKESGRLNEIRAKYIEE